MSRNTEYTERLRTRLVKFLAGVNDRICKRCRGRLTEPLYTDRDEMNNKIYESHCVNCGDIHYT